MSDDHRVRRPYGLLRPSSASASEKPWKCAICKGPVVVHKGMWLHQDGPLWRDIQKRRVK